MTKLGGLFKTLREGLGMSQERFAEVAETTRSTVGRAESGGPLYRYDSIVAIEEEFGAPIDVLLQTGAWPEWMADYRKLTPEQQRKVDAVMRSALELLKSAE